MSRIADLFFGRATPQEPDPTTLEHVRGRYAVKVARWGAAGLAAAGLVPVAVAYVNAESNSAQQRERIEAEAVARDEAEENIVCADAVDRAFDLLDTDPDRVILSLDLDGGQSLFSAAERQACPVIDEALDELAERAEDTPAP